MELGENTTLRAGWGLYHQSQGMNELEVADGETEFAPSERATQIAAGLEHRFASGLTARAEVYRRRVDRPRRQYLNLWREILAFPELDGDRLKIQPTEARAVGFEVLAQQAGDRWDWSLSYSLSSSEDLIDGTWVPRLMDRERWTNWQAAGASTMQERVTARLRKILATHTPPPLPPGAAEKIQAVLDGAEARAAVGPEQ